MIINRAEIDSAVSAYRFARKRNSQAARSVSFDTGSPDARHVSAAEAASFAEMAASVIAEPIYRRALVDDLQRRVAAGTYDVPAESIVEKLLVRLVLDALPA